MCTGLDRGSPRSQRGVAAPPPGVLTLESLLELKYVVLILVLSTRVPDPTRPFHTLSYHGGPCGSWESGRGLLWYLHY